MVGEMGCVDDLAQPCVAYRHMGMEYKSMKNVFEQRPNQHSGRDQPKQSHCPALRLGTGGQIEENCCSQRENPEGAKTI